MTTLGRTPKARHVMLAVAVLAAGAAPATAQGAGAGPPSRVDFMGNANSPISSSVGIPPNAAFVWTSGTTPSVADRSAAAGSRARYGDTKTQAVSVFQNLEARLKERGLTLKDVVYLRAYLVPDKELGGALDVQGWNAAYAQYFNTADNPTKPARSTIGVAALVNPDLLVEVEAFAVYPSR
jgi:enamine deaminase RidA (YjgF/YER057c/UK114 family)